MPGHPTRRRFMLQSALVLFVVTSLLGSSESAEPPHARVELLSEHTSLEPGTPTRIGVRFDIDEHWHVYWRHVGHSGNPPTLHWLVPDGFEVSEIQWPAPARQTHGDLAGYIYEHEVLLAATVTPPAGFEGEARIRVLAEWLVCEADEGCKPGEAALELTLPVAPETPRADDRTAALFARTAALLPLPLPAGDVAFANDANAIVLVMPRRAEWADETTFEFFPYPWDAIRLEAEQPFAFGADELTIELLREPGSSATRIEGVLVASAGSARRAYRIGDAPDMPIEFATEAAWVEATTPTALDVEPIDHEVFGGSSAEGPGSMAWALLGAFFGGLILNLMPCVLPVLSLKILGFVSQAGDDPKRIRKHGLAFGAGVVLTFQGLALVLILLQAGGEQLGWGFQLQDPRFVAAMAFLFLGLTLNLLGVFEFGLGLMGVAGRTQDRVDSSGIGASLANGILATLIATPCTAPFMGAALGFTLDQSAVSALLVFTTLGLGMAAPYVVLAWFPRWLDRLPRPGPWMVTFKRVMAIPLLATALWLVWLFGRLLGPDHARLLLAGLAIAALGFTLYGRFSRPGAGPRVRRVAGHGLAAVLIGVGVLVSLSGGTGASRSEGDDGGFWVPFDPHQVEQLRAQGRPVFIDFTADWCMTCKFNEETFIDVPEIHAQAERGGFVMMKADWTRRDPTITQALARFRRGSIPFYVLYSPDPGRKPVALREAITTSYVRNAMKYVMDR